MKEQLDVLQKLFNQISSTSQAPPTPNQLASMIAQQDTFSSAFIVENRKSNHGQSTLEHQFK